MKKVSFLLLMFSCIACEFSTSTTVTPSEEGNHTVYDTTKPKEEINIVLNEWHEAAAQANFEKYFSLMAEDGVFIGTDATENWQNEEFREFSQPYFEAGKAWNFTLLERNIYSGPEEQIAWFDELLSTQMGICRGSGVLHNVNGEWKIRHYVLSIAIPNENVSEVTEMKKDFDSTFIAKSK